MSREPKLPLTLAWRAELRQAVAGPACAVMADTFNGAQRPVDLILTAPLASAGACGPRFDASVLAITIRVQDRLAWDATFGLPFRVEP